MEKTFSTPILFLIFNRPDTTRRVFEEIRKAKPAKLYVAADGPRKGREGEFELCGKTREIIKQVDWECEVKTLFRDENLGCRMAVSSAIDWFFENVEEGIILEDDCLPHPSFFNFCQELLLKYKDDGRIMMISGNNFQDGIIRGEGNYYFSKNSNIWGWATWKRAWLKYDVNMQSFPSFRKGRQIKNVFQNKIIQKQRMKVFEDSFNGRIDTWDFQWGYAMIVSNGLSVVPNKNLVSNIGFRDDATHTKNKEVEQANMKVYEIGDLKHPPFMISDVEADNYYFLKKYYITRRINNIVFRFYRNFIRLKS